MATLTIQNPNSGSSKTPRYKKKKHNKNGNPKKQTIQGNEKSIERKFNKIEQQIALLNAKTKPGGGMAFNKFRAGKAGRQRILKEYKRDNYANFNFKPMTLDYLNLMTSPLDSVGIARMPDDKRLPTITLLDYVPSTQVSATAYMGTDNDGLAYGIVFWFGFGIDNFWYDNATYVDPSIVRPYRIYASVIDSRGFLTPWTESDFLGGYPFTNQTQIIPNIAGITLPITIAQSLRPIAMGMRVLPVIALVTDSNTPAMSMIYGGQLQTNNIWDAFWQDSNSEYSFDTYVQELYDTKHFTNEEGCCTRFNPFQMTDVRDFQTINNLAGSYQGPNDPKNYIDNFGDWWQPFIYCKFNQGISGTVVNDVTTFKLPLYFDARLILEATLNRPTPLIANVGNIDPAFDDVVKLMNSLPDDLKPFTTKGHSFKSFMHGAGKV